jgi:hypothetical protein
MKMVKVAINVKKKNKSEAKVMFLTFQSSNKRTIPFEPPTPCNVDLLTLFVWYCNVNVIQFFVI